MFENPLISRIPLRCMEHINNAITHICTDPNCEAWPLFCPECRNTYRYKEKHYGHELSVLELGQGIGEICGRLERDKKVIGGIYKQMVGVKGVESLLKWQ